MGRTRSENIRKASVVAILGNAILAVAKIIGGIFSGSLAVVGDGVDSCMDIVTSSIPYFASRIIDKPADTQHPYGHQRVETISTKVLSLIIFFVGFQLLFSNAFEFFQKKTPVLPTRLAIVVTLISILGKMILSYQQSKAGTKNESSMLLANAKNMRNDIITSIGVLVGLIFSVVFSMPIFDQIAAIFISFFIMRSAYTMFMETNNELMDGLDDVTLYDEIFDLVNNIDGVSNPHRIRIRKLAIEYVIDLDIEVDGKMSVDEAHKLTCRVEKAIRLKIANVYDVVVHTEPIGNKEVDEKFGFTKITEVKIDINQ